MLQYINDILSVTKKEKRFIFRVGAGGGEKENGVITIVQSSRSGLERGVGVCGTKKIDRNIMHGGRRQFKISPRKRSG